MAEASNIDAPESSSTSNYCKKILNLGVSKSIYFKNKKMKYLEVFCEIFREIFVIFRIFWKFPERCFGILRDICGKS